MSLALPSRNAQRWATARVALATLLIAGGMYAVIGHFASEVDRTRREQNRIGDVDRRVTGVLAALDRARLGEVEVPSSAERDAAEADVRELVRIEGRETTVGLSESLDQCLAAIDRETDDLHKGDSNAAMTESYETRPAHDRLRKELDALDARLQARAKGAVAATGVSTLVTLLLSSALVSFFAARHQRRTASLTALEAQTQSSEARERRFRLLLDIEEATADTTDPDRVLGAVVARLAEFLGVAQGAYEDVDRAGRTIGEPRPADLARDLPRLGPQDLASLRAGRTKVEAALIRCPLMREGALRAVVSLNGRDGRAWSHEEIALVEEVTGRCGAYVERMEADAAKRQSRWTSALLEAQVESSLDGILIVDPDGRQILQNDRMAEVWGIPDEIAKDRDDSRQVRFLTEAVKDPETFAATVRALYADPERIQRDEIELKNGTVLDRHTGPAVGSDGTIYGRIWTFRDITDRIASENARRQGEERLKRLMESIPQLVWMCEPDGHNLYFNSRWTEYTGLAAEESVGHGWRQAFHPDEQTAGTHARREPIPYETECRIRGVDGLYLWFLVRGVPILDAEGNVEQWFGTCTDIDVLKASEELLRDAQEALEARVEERTRDLAAATHEAERANAAKSEFLSRMSHELRTPLNAILGFGQILDRQELDELQKESVHYILKGGRHLLGLINEVLDISRVETGHAELSIEPVPLADVLVETFAMVRTMAADRDVQLSTEMAEEELHVVADRQRLKQVLINLLSNAVKYNRPGGRVTARVAAEDDRLCIAIEDTGRGIPPEGIAKLFTPFERLEASATSIEGTGLGLFLTQKLVTTMGGDLRVESVVGEGSTFTIELELARSPAETLALVQGGAPEPTDAYDKDRVYSVLSIEDNSANVRLLEAVLANRPEILLTAANQGMAGFELARRTEPDLILLDLNLPDVCGTEVLTRLKRSATTSGIPVIVISADAGEDKVHINLKAGAAAFLTKPLDVDRFLVTVDDALGIPRKEKRAA